MTESEYGGLVGDMRERFLEGKTKSLDWRIAQLKGLYRMYEENESLFCEALNKDLRKPKQEAVGLEVEYLRNDVRGSLHKIESWVQDHNVEKNWVTMLDSTYLHPDPLGIVLIIGAWNYPFQLTLGPLAGALAAGNCVVCKPSELAPASASLMASLLPRYLDPACVKVVRGGVQETTHLLKERFDYIFFTGSARVGQIIREAANKFLTPVTLELGGKSPVYIDSSADLVKAAKRIVWAKCINLGQTCIAPDYVLCTDQVRDRFVSIARDLLMEWYGPDPQKSADLCRIANKNSFSRLVDLLAATKGKIAVGGESDPAELYMAPTIVTGVTREEPLMQEEIFGPILPVLSVKSRQEALDFINSRDKPLSLYIFTTDKEAQEDFKVHTSSGSMVMNDAIVHLSVETLPFGGVGPSGMGAYHGKYTFDTFSHQKSVLARDFSGFGEWLGETRYPPYADWKYRRMALLLKNRKVPGFLAFIPHFLCFLLGLFLPYLYQRLTAN